MKLINHILTWWGKIFNKRRFSIQNAKNNIEEWYIYISIANIYTACISFVLLLFIIIISLVAYTPILDQLPGYRTNATRLHDNLTQEIIRLDSMERVVGDMRNYNVNIALILEGQRPIARTISDSDNGRVDKFLVIPNQRDSTLRAQMESLGQYKINNKALKSTSDIRKEMELALPAHGIVTEHFNIKDNLLGISVTTAPLSRISAVDNGTVVMSTWSPDNNYIIQIQHSNNRISTYKNLSQVVVSAGMLITKGELIGYSQERGENIKPFIFELWDSGKPIDPEQYIIF